MLAANHRPALRSNLAEINVTPLVDVMLVLLIIFMVTAPMMQSGIQVRLPTAETRATASPEGEVVTITRDGMIYIGQQSVPLDLLEPRLRNLFLGREKKVVFLKADEGISYGVVIQVMDRMKLAGIDTVGMVVDSKKKWK
ncbi:MAG TPA: biopolymer transporter ExbD [Candidatus Aminicenantes bacterium]|nr:biopolymer transporter ExbD [Candidatus Aminicenantes bacterium]